MSIDNIEAAETAQGGVSRRKLIKAAAWSAPVIAVAAATPLAAASHELPSGPGAATVAAQAGGTIVASEAAGTANGSFETTGVLITNVRGTWETGQLTGSYRLTGPWSTGSITKPDGSSFVVNETITYGGTVWTVKTVAANGRRVEFTGVSVSVTGPTTGTAASTLVSIPQAKYAGTFTPGTADEDNPLGATVTVSAANVNNGNTTSNASQYP